MYLSVHRLHLFPSFVKAFFLAKKSDKRDIFREPESRHASKTEKACSGCRLRQPQTSPNYSIIRKIDKALYFYPLTAPSMMPFTRYFCMARNMIRVGIKESTIVAHSVPYCHDAASSLRNVIPTDNV